MDVYYPLELSPLKKTPILFFIYGGRFVQGSRTLPNWPSIYGNVGSFFASKGFLTVIPDYRLVPHVTYPGPPQDICDALGWLAANVETVQADPELSIDLERVFVLGHSAGSAHSSNIWLDEEVRQYLIERFPYQIRGFISSGGVFHPFTAAENLADEIVNAYWGNKEEAIQKSPLSLLKNASQETVDALPDVLLVIAEDDYGIIKINNDEMHSALEERTQKLTSKYIAKRHNHISLVASPGSGEGEEWTEVVIAWIKERL
jgi:hypothetical protein